MSGIARPRGSRSRAARRGGAALALLVVLTAALAGCGGTHHAAAAGSRSVAGALDGLVPTPLPREPNFTLIDTAGKPFSLASATRGKLTYLYFGYTHCPDACPATMSDLTYALSLQPAATRRRIEVVFVTVDPRRDTRSVLRSWLDHYSRSFVGLTGSPGQIAAAEAAAGVPPAPPAPTASPNYTVAHSSVLFAFSPDGRAHVVYLQGFNGSEYAHDMPLLLRLKG
jgi:protein SCO1/2